MSPTILKKSPLSYDDISPEQDGAITHCYGQNTLLIGKKGVGKHCIAATTAQELVQDGVNGLTFRPRDPDDLQAKMVRLIRDASLRRQLRPRSDEVKDLATSAREHVELYESLQ